MTEKTEIARVELASEQALWDWLYRNHTGPSIWLVTWKAAHRDKYLSRDQVLDALIAYGWIDGRRMKLDDDRTMQLIAPRAQQAWARSYKVRAERLIAEGRMRPPGLVALEAGQASGLWSYSDDVDDLELPDDLRDALAAQDALDWFEGAAPSYRRNVLRYIKQAKRDATRVKRIAQVTDHAARGEKLPQY
ncbi:MAG: YdeI/OmpD-associated family protein [Pseudomonadota bacterium]